MKQLSPVCAGIGHVSSGQVHGGATKENAHPHCDSQQKIAVVHNGIIANYEELRSKLLLFQNALLGQKLILRLFLTSFVITWIPVYHLKMLSLQ